MYLHYISKWAFLIVVLVFGTNAHSLGNESTLVMCTSRAFSLKLNSTIECSFSFTKSKYYKCDHWINNSSMRAIVRGNDFNETYESSGVHPSLICISTSPLRIEVKTRDGDIYEDNPNIRQERLNQSAGVVQYKISIIFLKVGQGFGLNFAARYSIFNVEDPETKTKVLIVLVNNPYQKASDCYTYKLSDQFIEVKSEIVTLPCFAFVLKTSDEQLNLLYDKSDREVDKSLLNYDPMEGLIMNVSALTNLLISFECRCSGSHALYSGTTFSLLPPDAGSEINLVYVTDPKYNIHTITERSNRGLTLECFSNWENLKITGKNYIKKTASKTGTENEIAPNVYIQPVFRNKSGGISVFLASVEIPYLIADEEWDIHRSEFWNRSKGYTYSHHTEVNYLNEHNAVQKEWRIEYVDSYLQSGVLYSPLSLRETEGRFECIGDSFSTGLKLQILECKNALECQMNSICFDSQLENGHAVQCTKNVILISGNSCPGGERYFANGICSTNQPLNNGIAQCSSKIFNIRQAYFRGFDGKVYLEKDPPGDAVLRVTTIPSQKGEFYTLVPYTFLCEAHPFLHEHGFQWSVTYLSDTADRSQDSIKIIELVAANDSAKVESKVEIIFLEDTIAKVNCYAPLLYSREWRETSKLVTVKRAVTPEISVTETVKYFSKTSKDQSVTCQATGLPQPSIKWTRNGKDIESPLTVFDSVFRHVLHFPVYNDSFSGEYLCSAWNVAGKVEKLFQIRTDIAGNSNQMYYIIVPVAVCISGLFAYLMRREKMKQYQELKNLMQTLNGALDTSGGENDPVELPFDTNYELEKHSFSIDKGVILGKGAYGIVYKGRIEGVEGPVAFKTLKPNSPIEKLRALISELKIMMYIGEHENLVSLFGAYRQEIRQSILYVAIEFCEFGSLESYLRKYKHLFLKCPVLNSYRTNAVLNNDAICEINFGHLYSIRSLLKWCYQIANGMDFLGTKNVIHSDLATRNVLLTAEGNAKVTDFGLSRRTYNYSEYIKKTKERMPWRSMAVESLVSKNYSSKSDVWAYGITLWEIFSLGEVPYPGIDPAMEFVHELEKGLRNFKPKYSSTEIYQVMIDCWHLDPNQRPSFSTLKTFFADAAVSNNIDVVDNAHSNYSNIMDITSN